MNVLLLLVAGLVVPPVASFLKKQSWSSRVKVILSAAVSFVVAAGVMAVQGDFSSIHNFIAQASVVWASALGFYHLYFSETDLNAWLESVGIHS